MGHSELRTDGELVRAPTIRERAQPDDVRQAPESGLTATVLQLQRAAGNQAVTSALAESRWASGRSALPFAVQREPAAGGSTSASSGQLLAALWNAQVVLPLARAAERVARDKPDLKGARPDLETALGTIANLRTATAAEDPNHVRLQIVEQRARMALSRVDHALGRKVSGHPLENGMIAVRAEATELGPTLQHQPDVEGLLRQGSATASAAAAPQAGTPASGPQGGVAVAPATAPPATAPAATSGPDMEGASIADVWKVLVVDRLWLGQRTLEEDPDMAYFHWSVAIGRIVDFFEATPQGHPSRPQLLKLFTDLMAVHDLMGERAKTFGGDPLADRAEEAYSTAVDMAEILFGEPPKTSEAPEGAESAEPDFTWERERPPMVNDTDLERP